MVETRRMNGKVYRKRACRYCDHRFVSIEYSGHDVSFPPELNTNSGRRKQFESSRPPLATPFSKINNDVFKIF